jgi:hypothetical protein
MMMIKEPICLRRAQAEGDCGVCLGNPQINHRPTTAKKNAYLARSNPNVIKCLYSFCFALSIDRFVRLDRRITGLGRGADLHRLSRQVQQVHLFFAFNYNNFQYFMFSDGTGNVRIWAGKGCCATSDCNLMLPEKVPEKECPTEV